jgi:drug/metabolite transporter (DMT)-like permease
MRSIFAILILSVSINRNLKSVMYVSRELYPKFILRVLLGILSILTMNFAVKSFSLSVVAVLNNINPILTMLFAWLLLKEKVTKLDLVSIILVFSSVMMMLLGITTSPKKSHDELSVQWKLFLVVSLPLLAVTSSLTSR